MERAELLHRVCTTPEEYQKRSDEVAVLLTAYDQRLFWLEDVVLYGPASSTEQASKLDTLGVAPPPNFKTWSGWLQKRETI